MARTQKNKATECHFGVMKARLAKLRQEVFSSSFLPIFNPILIDCSFLNSYLILLLQVAVASPVKVSMSPDRVMLVLPLLVSLLLVNPLYWSMFFLRPIESITSYLTGTKSEAAAYEFTTLTCIPGNIYYKGVKIQMLDLPGIIEGAARGRGRGRQVIAVAKSADLIMMVLDAGREEEKNHREILEHELESV